jgi:DNA primase
LAEYIPEEIVEQVRNAAGIVDVVSEYVMLKKTGKNFTGLCPFHTDSKPSFTVSEEKQIFHCFGCGQGGNVFRFLMQYNHLSFPESVAFLARKHGIQIPSKEMSPHQKKELEETEKLLRINAEAVKHFRQALESTGPGTRARDYLSRRAMSREVIDRFLLGYAPKSWTSVMEYLSRQGVSIEDQQKVGLVVASKGRHYDRFRDRIIFPIVDVHDRVVGFGGRCLDDSLPKYLNSPETPVYHKSKTLYGLNAARGACRQDGSVFIVEGYFDLLALQCQGIQNVVATLGTALTQQHVRVLKGYARKMVLVFDSDEAGIKAAKRSLSVFMDEKVEARILVLPEGMDPDSFIQEVGSAGFIKAAEQAVAAVPFLVTSAIQKYGLSLEGKVQVVEALKGPLGLLPDKLSRSVYIRDLAERLDIDEAAILERVRASKQGESGQPALPGNTRRGSRLEHAVAAIMIKHPTVLDGLDPEKIVAGFETADLKKLGTMIVKRFNANQSVTGPDLIAATDDAELGNLISSFLMEDLGDDLDDYWKVVRQYENHQRKLQIRKLSKRIKEAEEADDQELLSRLLAEKQKWAQRHLEAL